MTRLPERTIAALKLAIADRDGFCQCGCGQRTMISDGTDRARGDVRGMPRKYILGHRHRAHTRPVRESARDCGDHFAIPLPGGKEALVDRDVLELLGERRCYMSSHGYVRVASMDHVKDYLHRVIMRPPAGMTVDHINGNRLDSRRANLRVCTQGENNRNQPNNRRGYSRFKGVRVRKNLSRPFAAQVIINGTVIRCGWFATEEEAARAYDAAAKRYHGQFARLNFPDGEVQSA